MSNGASYLQGSTVAKLYRVCFGHSSEWRGLGVSLREVLFCIDVKESRVLL